MADPHPPHAPPRKSSALLPLAILGGVLLFTIGLVLFLVLRTEPEWVPSTKFALPESIGEPEHWTIDGHQVDVLRTYFVPTNAGVGYVIEVPCPKDCEQLMSGDERVGQARLAPIARYVLEQKLHTRREMSRGGQKAAVSDVSLVVVDRFNQRFNTFLFPVPGAPAAAIDTRPAATKIRPPQQP